MTKGVFFNEVNSNSSLNVLHWSTGRLINNIKATDIVHWLVKAALTEL